MSDGGNGERSYSGAITLLSVVDAICGVLFALLAVRAWLHGNLQLFVGNAMYVVAIAMDTFARIARTRLERQGGGRHTAGSRSYCG